MDPALELSSRVAREIRHEEVRGRRQNVRVAVRVELNPRPFGAFLVELVDAPFPLKGRLVGDVGRRDETREAFGVRALRRPRDREAHDGPAGVGADGGGAMRSVVETASDLLLV